MEGNLARGRMIAERAPCANRDSQASTRVHQPLYQRTMHLQQHPTTFQGSSFHAPARKSFPFTVGTIQNCGQFISIGDCNRQRDKATASDEEVPSLTEEPIEGQNDAYKECKGPLWHRVKWTDEMVRLLITAVTCIGEDLASECAIGGKRKFVVFHKKGKWKSISKVMAERGCNVSPQQCEDKFNDLNRRYKKLNEILGRETSHQVVKNPALLDLIDYLTEKQKDEIRKILSSKQLFYEEMCSYHRGNRLHLPHDPELQRSLQLTLQSKGDHGTDDVRKLQLDDHHQDMKINETDGFEENFASHVDARGMLEMEDVSWKWMRHDQANVLLAQTAAAKVLPDNTRAARIWKQQIELQTLQLEEQMLQIQVEMSELEKQRSEWERYSRKKNRDLEKLRMENDRMKLENKRMALELKRKKMV